MTQRKTLSKRLRYGIFARDRFTCRYCGREAGDAVLVIDHIHPVALGGDNDPSNLITSCADCNAGKGAQTPVSAVPTSADLRRVEQERVALEEAAEAVRRQRAARDELFQQAVNLLCAAVGRKDFDMTTARIVTRYIEEHGPEAVIAWVNIARDRLGQGVDDITFGRYVSGIRRRALEEATPSEAIVSGDPVWTDYTGASQTD